MQLLRHLFRQVQNVPGEGETGIVLIQQNAKDLQIGIEGILHRLDDVLDLRDAHQTQDLRLHGENDAGGGHIGVDSQDVQGGRRVNDDKVIAVFHGVQLLGEHELPPGGGEFHLCGGEENVRGEDVTILRVGDGLLNGAVSLQHVVDGVAVANIQAQGKAQVALGVQVDAQNPGAPFMQAADQGGDDGGLAHTALLI